MIDLHHLYGNDLDTDATGDLLLAQDTEYGQQRVLRRLLTNPLDDLWNPLYGGGLSQEVGRPAAPQRVQAIVRTQMANEAVVAADPPVSVGVLAQVDGTMIVSIAYADAQTGSSNILTLPLGTNA